MVDALHSLTIGDVARENARRFPNRTALVCGPDRLTFPELDRRSTRLANRLAGEGVVAGDRVLWPGQNCHRVVELLVACSKLGAVFLPANWRLSEPERGFVLEDAAPRVVVPEDPDSYEAFLAGAVPDDPEVAVDDATALLMIYTGAFEGRPNGSLTSSTSLIGQALLTAMAEHLSHDDVFLASGPLFHIGCWRYVLAMFVLGGTTVMLPRVDAEEICRLVAAERCTHAYLLDATQEQIVEVNADRRYDLSSLRSVRGSVAWEAMVSVQPNPWLEQPQRYGQTEAGGIVAFGAFGPPPAGGHGRTHLLAQLRLFRADGSECEPGEAGEIVVRGPLVMNGYHDRPELNTRKFAGGWLRTGDLGRREDDGSITFLGTSARMLKCGLENVYPVEVEQALRGDPSIADCAVIGVPDARFIQVVKAIVVPAEGCVPTAESVIDYARSCLARYKVPKAVAFVSALPRLGGAIDYAALDEQHGGGNYPGGDTPTGR